MAGQKEHILEVHSGLKSSLLLVLPSVERIPHVCWLELCQIHPAILC